MIYIVEIESLHGSTATKEYEGYSIREVIRRAELDLQAYPNFHIVHVTADTTTVVPQRAAQTVNGTAHVS